MFFEQEYISLTVVNAVKLQQQIGRKLSHRRRNYCSISLRYDSEAMIECGGKMYDVSNKICYFPGWMPYTRLSKNDNILAIDFQTSSCISTQLESFLPENPQAYRTLFEEAIACWQEKEPGYRYRVTAIVYQILAMAYNENQKNGPIHPLLEEAIRLIDQNISSETFKIETMAKQLSISGTYLRTLFNDAFGISPKQYLLQKRIHQAISLLNTHHFTVMEVADQVGFDDPKHFSTQFKKIVGVSPSTFIKSAHYLNRPPDTEEPIAVQE